MSMSASVAGVLLAAGAGSRLGQPKALVEIDGHSLAGLGAVMLSTGGADPVVVVTGAVPVQLSGVVLAHNPDWQSGMGSSMAVGLAAVPDRCTAAVLALADQPLVAAAAVQRLIDAYREGAVVAVAAYEGQPRNPVLIAREFWPQAIALAVGDVGARPFLRAHPELVTLVECGDTGRPDDIDTPEDLERVRRLIATSDADPRQD